MIKAKHTHRAYIRQLTVASTSPYIVYGDVRGLIGEHRTAVAALRTLRRDESACASLGGGAYSDASVYEWQEDGGWVPMYEDWRGQLTTMGDGSCE